MKLATTTSDFSLYTTSTAEAMEYIAQAGFKYIDYSFGNDYAENKGIFSENWEEYLQELLQKAEKLGVRFVQSHAPMGRPIVQGEGYQPFIEANLRCIEACAKLGIDNVVIHTGYAEGLSREECFDENKRFFEALIPTAKRCGVYILIENFNKMCIPGLYWIDNATDLNALADYIDSPWIKCCFDIGHANLQETSQSDELKILGDRVHAIHVQDNCGDDDYHLAPFFGTTNFDDVINGLKTIGYKGYFTFEACSMFSSPHRRRPFDGEKRLKKAPLDLRIKAEALLYEIGKAILSAYDMFEK